jgi:hypothetical protein
MLAVIIVFRVLILDRATLYARDNSNKRAFNAKVATTLHASTHTNEFKFRRSL